MNVYDLITELLAEKNMSRRELSLKAGIPVTTLNSAFSRKSQKLSASVISAIAKALDVSIEYLVNLGNNYIHKIRAEKKVSNVELSGKTGLPIDVLREMESAYSLVLSADTQKVAAALGVEEKDLFPAEEFERMQRVSTSIRTEWDRAAPYMEAQRAFMDSLDAAEKNYLVALKKAGFINGSIDIDSDTSMRLRRLISAFISPDMGQKDLYNREELENGK